MGASSKAPSKGDQVPVMVRVGKGACPVMVLAHPSEGQALTEPLEPP